MRRIAGISGLTVLLLLLAGQPAAAQRLQGTVKVGAIAMDEDAGDVTAIQETANIYDGFSLSQVLLRGDLGRDRTFRLDVQEANLDSRRGLFTFRGADVFDLKVRYDRRRQLYDAAGSVESERKDWTFGAGLRPVRWLRVTGDYNRQTRQGDRWGYPLGVESFLGAGYDYTLSTGRVEAEATDGPRKYAVGFESTRFEDGDLAAAERCGQVISARVSLPCLLLPGKVSHFARGSYGKQKLEQPDLEYTLSTFQYVGVVRPSRPWQFDYRFYASRLEDDATALRTDQVRNDFDLSWRHQYGKLFGGYGYVTHDDDRRLTSTDVWRVGAVLADGRKVQGRVSYASSEKTDTEQLTLLKDIESSRLRISMQAAPTDRVGFGASFVNHDREFPIIGVESTGRRWATNGRYAIAGLGAFCVDYSYSDDKYVDHGGGFTADCHAVTGRLSVERIRDLKLTAGVTYLDIGKELDIEKSIVMFAGEYTLQDDYFVEVKYNVYNYDDYILMDRYYTANVVWVNVGYKLSID